MTTSVARSSIQHSSFTLQVPFEAEVDGFANMERDAELLKHDRLGARVYTWNGPWISLGMSQDPARDLLPNQATPTVMRPTGGRAVLHGHDITLGLACPLRLLAEPNENPMALGRSVRSVYRRIIEPIRRALVEVGIPADLAEHTPFSKQPGRSADCFATASPNDVVRTDTGAKICGVALRLTESAVLVQASIPAGPPLVNPKSVFADPAPIAWCHIPVLEFGEALTGNLSRLVDHGLQ
ncbi:MAG: Octanoyltransferase LipM [Fimbriimonadaceae bacterium]|nr:Octanoyltransferase LipM [Fimbriimonadaceae bacterium]